VTQRDCYFQKTSVVITGGEIGEGMSDLFLTVLVGLEISLRSSELSHSRQNIFHRLAPGLLRADMGMNIPLMHPKAKKTLGMQSNVSEGKELYFIQFDQGDTYPRDISAAFITTAISLLRQ